MLVMTLSMCLRADPDGPDLTGQPRALAPLRARRTRGHPRAEQMRKIDRIAGPGARFLVLAELQRPGRPRQARWMHHHDTGHGPPARQSGTRAGRGRNRRHGCLLSGLTRPSQSLTRLGRRGCPRVRGAGAAAPEWRGDGRHPRQPPPVAAELDEPERRRTVDQQRSTCDGGTAAPRKQVPLNRLRFESPCFRSLTSDDRPACTAGRV